MLSHRTGTEPPNLTSLQQDFPKAVCFQGQKKRNGDYKYPPVYRGRQSSSEQGKGAYFHPKMMSFLPAKRSEG